MHVASARCLKEWECRGAFPGGGWGMGHVCLCVCVWGGVSDLAPLKHQLSICVWPHTHSGHFWNGPLRASNLWSPSQTRGRPLLIFLPQAPKLFFHQRHYSVVLRQWITLNDFARSFLVMIHTNSYRNEDNCSKGTLTPVDTEGLTWYPGLLRSCISLSVSFYVCVHCLFVWAGQGWTNCSLAFAFFP